MPADKPAHTPFREVDTLARWPLRYIERTRQYFLEIHPPTLAEGRQWINVVELTHIADDLMLNGGHIQNGEVMHGPGEAFATIGDEGNFAIVLHRDGTTSQHRIIDLALDTKIPTS